MKSFKFWKKEAVVMNKGELKAELYGMSTPIEKAIECMKQALDEMDENPNSAKLHISYALGTLTVSQFGINELKREL